MGCREGGRVCARRWDRGKEGGGRGGRKRLEFSNSALKVHHLRGENNGPEADNIDRKSYLSQFC